MLNFLHWRSLFRRDKFENAMADEFAFHLQARTDDLVRSGLSPQDAERRARVEFGGSQRDRAECRESHRVHLLDELGHNIRYAFRSLRRNPTFSLVAVLSLELGIGVNTLLFSVFNSLILPPARRRSRSCDLHRNHHRQHSFISRLQRIS